MDNDFDELQRQWQKGIGSIEPKASDMENINALIKNKKGWSIRFHYGNIIVLSVVLIVISLFFYCITPVQEILSRIGVGMMIGGLLVRIIIEFISVAKSKKINMMDDALQTTNNTISFYEYRKTIHGPVTLTIVALYTIGFYMITPEFSLYLKTWQVVLIDTSYIFAAIIPFIGIRSGIRKEMKILSEIIALRKKMI